MYKYVKRWDQTLARYVCSSSQNKPGANPTIASYKTLARYVCSLSQSKPGTNPTIASYKTLARYVCSSSQSKPGTNPTIASYNASVVNFYNAAGSLTRFENKNILFYFEKRCSLLQRWRCICKFKSRRIGSRFLKQNSVPELTKPVISWVVKSLKLCLTSYVNEQA
jgi:hypothetical protein